MKVEINKVTSLEDEKAFLNVVEVSNVIQDAIDILENNCRTITVYNEGEALILKTDKIYYVESVDKKSYVYTKVDCFETKLRLYEIEETYDSSFFRCSKAMIVNIRKIKSVKTELNGRLMATLLNGEEVIVARNYVKDLKERLGI